VQQSYFDFSILEGLLTIFISEFKTVTVITWKISYAFSQDLWITEALANKISFRIS